MRESLEVRRKRLLFRSLRRGTKESDLVIGGFAEAFLDTLDAAQLDRFEALLDLSDPELLGWVIGLEPVPAAYDNDVMAMLVRFRQTL